MLPTILSTGDAPFETSTDDWETVLEVSGQVIVNHIVLINEGDWAGYWRIVDQDDNATAPVRLTAGAGDSGERRSAVTVPTPGLSGARLQVKRGLGGGHLSGIHAYAM